MATTALGFNSKLSFAPETSYLNATTTGFEELNQKGNTLSLSFATLTTERIRGDRNTDKILKGSHSVTGDITFDLSPDPDHNELIHASLCTPTALDADDDASGTVYVNGSTQRSFVFVREFNDINFTGDTQIFTGCQINSFNMSIPADGFIECSVSVMGATMTVADAHPDTDGSPAVPPTATVTPFTAQDARVKIAGSEDTTITEISLTIENGMSPVYVIGNEKPVEGTLGKMSVTGSLTAHFPNNTNYARFLNVASQEAGTDAIIIEIDNDNTDYNSTDGIKFNLPTCAFTTGATEVTADGAVLVNLEFTALYNAGIDGAIQFDTDLAV
jgi:hypothetical protein